MIRITPRERAQLIWRTLHSIPPSYAAEDPIGYIAAQIEAAEERARREPPPPPKDAGPDTPPRPPADREVD